MKVLSEKHQKSALGLLLKSIVTAKSTTADNAVFVPDGGASFKLLSGIWMLHTNKHMRHMPYVHKDIMQQIVPLFDGYKNKNSIKAAEQK